MGALREFLDFVDDGQGVPDDAAWDRLLGALWIGIQAFWIGAIYFMDLIVLDIYWTRAMLVSWVVIALFVTRIGAWTIRKLAVMLTVYAVAYFLGVAPALQTVGAYLTRMLS